MPDISDYSRRAAAEDEALHAAYRHRVARLVAAYSTDTADARLLFDALGLDPAEGLSAEQRAERACREHTAIAV